MRSLPLALVALAFALSPALGQRSSLDVPSNSGTPMSETYVHYRATAVDQQNGTPLAGVALKVWGRDESGEVQFLTLESDERGVFACPVALLSKSIHQGSAEHSLLPVLDHGPGMPWDDPANQVAFECGPELVLRVAGEVPKSGLEVFIAEPGARFPFRVSHAYKRADGFVGAWLRPWEESSARTPKAGAAVRIGLRDQAGILCGVASFRWAPELFTVPIPLRLEPTAAVNISVEPELPYVRTAYEQLVDREGYAATESLSEVELDKLGYNAGLEERYGDDPVESVFLALSPSTESLLELDPWRGEAKKWLPPGRYQFSARTRRHQEARLDLNLKGGTSASHVLPLDLLVGLRTITGTVRTESGAPLFDCDVVVRVGGDPLWTWTIVGGVVYCWDGVSLWLDEGATPDRATFEVPAAPPGEVEVAVQRQRDSGGDTIGAFPSRVEITGDPGGHQVVELVLLDGPAAASFDFTLENNGSKPPPFIRVFIESGPVGLLPPQSRTCYVGGIGRKMGDFDPTEHPFTWRIESPGFRPIRGGSEDFEETSPRHFSAALAFERED